MEKIPYQPNETQRLGLKLASNYLQGGLKDLREIQQHLRQKTRYLDVMKEAGYNLRPAKPEDLNLN